MCHCPVSRLRGAIDNPAMQRELTRLIILYLESRAKFANIKQTVLTLWPRNTR